MFRVVVFIVLVIVSGFEVAGATPQSEDVAKAEEYNAKGLKALREGDVGTAMADFDKAIEASHFKHQDYYHNRAEASRVLAECDLNNGGVLLLNSSDFKGAIRYFDEAIKLDPDYALCYDNRAFAKKRMGDEVGAAEDIKKRDEAEARLKQRHHDGLPQSQNSEMDLPAIQIQISKRHEDIDGKLVWDKWHKALNNEQQRRWALAMKTWTQGKPLGVEVTYVIENDGSITHVQLPYPSRNLEFNSLAEATIKGMAGSPLLKLPAPPHDGGENRMATFTTPNFPPGCTGGGVLPDGVKVSRTKQLDTSWQTTNLTVDSPAFDFSRVHEKFNKKQWGIGLLHGCRMRQAWDLLHSYPIIGMSGADVLSLLGQPIDFSVVRNYVRYPLSASDDESLPQFYLELRYSNDRVIGFRVEKAVPDPGHFPPEP